MTATRTARLLAEAADRQALAAWLESWADYIESIGGIHPYPPTPEQFRRWAEAVKEMRP